MFLPDDCSMWHFGGQINPLSQHRVRQAPSREKSHGIRVTFSFRQAALLKCLLPPLAEMEPLINGKDEKTNQVLRIKKKNNGKDERTSEVLPIKKKNTKKQVRDEVQPTRRGTRKILKRQLFADNPGIERGSDGRAVRACYCFQIDYTNTDEKKFTAIDTDEKTTFELSASENDEKENVKDSKKTSRL